MSSVAEKRRTFGDSSIYETCFVYQEVNAYMYASIVKKAKLVSLCSVKCFTAYNELIETVSTTLKKSSK